jgi:hypothetical protein
MGGYSLASIEYASTCQRTPMQPEYLPPSATLTEPVSKPRSSVVAVLLGGLVVDFLGTLAAAILAAVIVSAAIVSGGGGDAEVTAGLGSLAFLVAITAIGEILVAAGGYVAARWARRRPVAHGVAAGTLSLVLGLPFLLLPGATEPLWLVVVGLIVHVPLAALGGHLAGRRPA